MKSNIIPLVADTNNTDTARYVALGTVTDEVVGGVWSSGSLDEDDCSLNATDFDTVSSCFKVLLAPFGCQELHESKVCTRYRQGERLNLATPYESL